MPHWIFARDSKGKVHQIGGSFHSDVMAQEWIDSHLDPQADPEVFFSPHTDPARVTQEWKFKRIEKDGLDMGTQRIRHPKSVGEMGGMR